MLILGSLLGLVVGGALGLLGGGGSILTVPVFVYVLDLPVKQAVPASLAVVGVTALVGAARHGRYGHVRVGTALLFGAGAMVGAFAGARIAEHLTATFQMALFALVMLTAALSMFRGRPEREGLSGRHLLAVPLVAVPVGVLTGIVGVGGGFLIVPALVLLLALPMREAVGTSLLVISLNAAAGFAGYLGRAEIPWELMGVFTLFTVAGILLGAPAAARVPQGALRRGFAVFLLMAGVAILYENRTAFSGSPEPRAFDAPGAVDDAPGADLRREAGAGGVAAGMPGHR